MTSAGRVPPGRAGRLRLRHSLDVAERGADLLERKLRILRAEHGRLLRAEEEAANSWQDALPRAETWLLRGLLLGGEHALEAAAADVGPAEAEVCWASSMGVRHPEAVTVTAPARPSTAAAPGNSALIHAEAAYRRVLAAAGAYAAARAAAAVVGAEVLGTRRRVRALRRHLVPRLRERLALADLALEQGEHEDTVRRRWATRVREE
jgi:vacuolar-type H+-ATPase subunit D/Vma8